MIAGASLMLDVTRTVSRVGLGRPTGIDRVERAWIEWALSERWPQSWFLARIAGGTHVIDADCMKDLLAVSDGEAPPPPLDLRARLSLKKRPIARRAEALLRRRAKRPPPGAIYANVGHANLTPQALTEATALGASRLIVKIHDVIPLERPEFARPDGAAKMRLRLAAAAAADGVIYNSADTRMRAQSHMNALPPNVIAPLGVEIGDFADAPRHDGFVVLGTIEPRKNHALLLNVWAAIHAEMAAAAPKLHIVGRRGWMNEDIFARLDADPAMGVSIFERGEMPDHAVNRLVAGARALLFPSFAEGYGLPLAEALALGAPVIASDLPALREVGGDAPLWLAPDDEPAWREAVLEFARPASGRRDARVAATADYQAPRWADHFAAVDELLGRIV